MSHQIAFSHRIKIWTIRGWTRTQTWVRLTVEQAQELNLREATSQRHPSSLTRLKETTLALNKRSIKWALRELEVQDKFLISNSQTFSSKIWTKWQPQEVISLFKIWWEASNNRAMASKSKVKTQVLLTLEMCFSKIIRSTTSRCSNKTLKPPLLHQIVRTNLPKERTQLATQYLTVPKIR